MVLGSNEVSGLLVDSISAPSAPTHFASIATPKHLKPRSRSYMGIGEGSI
jgi:hypothetical protein